MAPDNGESSDSIFRREGKALLETAKEGMQNKMRREGEGERSRGEG